ncbi:hypothetical protein SKAU_G00240290 [Synaphobranchus kaupii]|uniref:Uncharacterized protein n=1 Tax=Synaphobranchus kaupii TaxID=118154 RepID=A0A9Q1IS58_SYNKA|nr:hypothetical protein SKAU_G00240290 [Synaphobranchus kaupii]
MDKISDKKGRGGGVVRWERLAGPEGFLTALIPAQVTWFYFIACLQRLSGEQWGHAVCKLRRVLLRRAHRPGEAGGQVGATTFTGENEEKAREAGESEDGQTYGPESRPFSEGQSTFRRHEST